MQEDTNEKNEDDDDDDGTLDVTTTIDGAGVEGAKSK